MSSTRRTAVVAGVLFLITHVTSVGAVLVYGPVLHDPDPLGSGSDTGLLVGVLLEVFLALAIVGTAVALHPVVKRQNEGVALGYVGLRTLEAAVIAVGVVPLLALVTLRQDLMGAAADAGTLGSILVSLHNWTFLVGPSFVCGTNTVLLAYLLYRSGLVPRFISVLGLVGGPLVFASGTAQMFGLIDQISVWAGIGAVPIFAWEICLAVYLIAKGFRPMGNLPSESTPVAESPTFAHV
jgi:hypothetical protein